MAVGIFDYSGWGNSMARGLKRLLRPDVLIPVVLIVGAIALLFGFGNPARILATMESFNRVDLVWVFLLTATYEAIRFVQWWYLLRHEGIHVPLKAQVFSFAGGEATRFLPIGNYFENYLLTAAEGVDFGFSSAVTTLTVLLEVAVSLTGLVILGLGSWWWVRPLIVAGVAIAAALAWLFYRFHSTLDAPAWVCRNNRARKAWEGITGELRQFVRGARKLMRWRTLLISYLLSAAYLVTAGGILYVILAGIGWSATPYGEVLAVYFFSLAFGLIFPLPVDVGVTELSGVGAFLVVGVERNVAISAMLINRVLTLGFSILIAVVVCLVLREEFRKALHARGAKQTGQLGLSEGGETPAASPAGSSAASTSSIAPAPPRHPAPHPGAIAGGRWRPRSHHDYETPEDTGAVPDDDPTRAAS